MRPSEPRDASKLLVCLPGPDGETWEMRDHTFREAPQVNLLYYTCSTLVLYCTSTLLHRYNTSTLLTFLYAYCTYFTTRVFYLLYYTRTLQHVHELTYFTTRVLYLLYYTRGDTAGPSRGAAGTQQLQGCRRPPFRLQKGTRTLLTLLHAYFTYFTTLNKSKVVRRPPFRQQKGNASQESSIHRECYIVHSIGH